MTMKGALVAASVAGLFASAIPLTASADKAAEKNVSCMGINACSGKGSCKSVNNACAGKNSCKGKGITSTTAKDCKAKKGTVASAK